MKNIFIFSFLIFLSSVTIVHAQESKWPFPLVKEDGHDTGNLVCISKKTYQDFFSKSFSDQNMRIINKDFFTSGKCYTLMSNWGIEIDHMKNPDDYIVKYTITTKTHGEITAYGSGIEDE